MNLFNGQWRNDLFQSRCSVPHVCLLAHFRKDKKNIDQVCWRCCTAKAHEISVRKYSFFERAHFTIQDIMLFIKQYFDGVTLLEATRQAEICYQKSGVDWASFIRELFKEDLHRSLPHTRLSGEVEMDESLFGRRTIYHRGRPQGSKVWISGPDRSEEDSIGDDKSYPLSQHLLCVAVLCWPFCARTDTHTHQLTPGLGVTIRSCLFHTLHLNSQSMVVNISTPHEYNSKQHLSSLHIHRLNKWYHQLTHIWHINSLEKQTSKWSFQRFRSQQIVNSNALERCITNTTAEVKSKVYDRKKGLGRWAICLALKFVSFYW